MLNISGVTKRFGGLVAVKGVSFSAPSRQITSLIGPNGAGKTTLFNLISGLLAPDEGRIQFSDTDITGWQAHRVTKLGLSRTFQNVQLFPNLTVLENVAVARYCRSGSGVLDAVFWTRRDRSDRATARARAVAALERVGMSGRESYWPQALPYGDQRRVEIARALASDPQFVILDEPTAGMTARESREMMDLMRSLVEDGIAILLIEHNINVVMSVSDKIVVLNFGQVIAQGQPQEVQANQDVIQAYLGLD